MGATTERFKKLIEDKKNALKNLQGEALLDATAEVVYLDYTLKKRIKDTNDPEVWDRPSMMKLFDSQLSNGNYSDVRKARIAQIKGNIPNLINRLGFTDPNEPLPEEMYEYAANPDTLTDEKMMAIRNQLYGKNYSFKMFVKPKEGFGDGQISAIEKTCNFFANEHDSAQMTLKNYFNRQDIAEKLNRYSERIGLLKDRPGTHANTFRMYLIAKKGFTFADTYQILPGHKDFDQLLEDFLTFLRTHPVRPLEKGVVPDDEHPAVTEEQCKENAKVFIEMMNECADRLADMQIPDVDYNDLDSVKNVLKEFGSFRSFMQDFGQQQQGFNGNHVVAELPQEFAECQKKMLPAYQIVRFSKSLEEAYLLDRSDRVFNTRPEDHMKIKAALRYYFSKEANEKFRGKTGTELSAEVTVKDLYAEQLPTLIIGKSLLYDDITTEDVEEYLKTGKGALPGKMDIHIKEEEDELRLTTFNYSKSGSLASAISSAYTSNDKTDLEALKTFTKALFGDGNKTFEEIVRSFINFEDLQTLNKAYAASNVYYNKIFVDNDRNLLYQIAGVDDPITSIKIDGKSPEEIWPELANFNGDDKRDIIRFAIINEILNGDRKVTITNYVIDENDRLLEGRPYVICDSVKNIERTKDFLREVDNLHGRADSLKSELQNPTFTVDPGNAPLYEEMKRALDELSEKSKISGNNDLKSLSEAWKHFADVSIIFYDAQIQSVTLNNGSEEQLRALEKQRQVVYNSLAEQFSFVVNKTKGLDEVLTPDAYDEESYGTFENIYDRLKTQIKKKELDENKVENLCRLHGEVSEETPKEFRWFVDEPFEDVINAGPQLNQLFQKCNIQTDEAALKLFNANNTSMQGTDYSKYIAPEENVASFLNHNGISTRATAESYFMFYCMGWENLSLEETLKLMHAHDKGENGAYLDPAAHAKALKLEENFIKFVTTHPADPAAGKLTKNQAEKAAEDWLILFKNYTDKIKEYKWPDIDYSDPEQVNAHYDELYALGSLFGDGHQELDRIVKSSGYNEYFDISVIGAKALGSEEEYWNMRGFYSNMQAVIANGFKNGYVIGQGTTFTPVKISQIAAYRALAGEYMSTFAGKSVGQAYEENFFKVNFAVRESIEWNYIIDGNTSLPFPEGMKETDPAMVLGFLTNHNKHEFKEWLDQHKQTLYDYFRTVNHPSLNIQKQLEYRSKPMNEDLRNGLLAVDDSAQSMIDFLNAPLGTKTGRDAVLIDAGFWVDKYEHNLFYIQGLKESDAFLINGRTAKELWSEKYDQANVTDPVLREHLYRAEILKCMAEGKSVISLRGITISKDNLVSLSKPVGVALPKDEMVRMYEAYMRYAMKKGDLLSSVRHTIDRISEANPKETDELINFQNALKRAASVLASGHSKYAEIAEKLFALEEAAGAYYEENKNSKDAAVKECVSFAERFKSGIADNLYAERKIFASDRLMSKGNKTFAEDVEYELQTDFESLGRGTGVLPVQRRFHDFVGMKPEEDAFAREKINEELKNLRASEEYKRIMSADANNEEKLALQYLERKYTALIAPALAGEAKKELKFNDIRGAENILKDVPKYADNVLFTSNMKKDPDKTIKVWSEVEAGAETLRTSYQQVLDKYVSDAGSLERHVAGLKKGENKDMTLADVVANNSRNPEGVKATNESLMYHLLAETVWLQILTQKNEVSRQIREGINRNPDNYIRYMNAVETLLKANQVLSSRSKADRVIEHLKSGKLRDDTLKILQDSAADLKKQNEEERATAQNAKEEAFRQTFDFLYAPNVNIDSDRFRYVVTQTGVHDEEDVEDSFIKMGQDLKEVKYQINGENKEIKLKSEDFSNAELTEGGARQSMFILYLMAKKDLSFEDAVELATRKEIKDQNDNVINADALNEANILRGEFAKFVLDNRMKQQTQQVMEKSLENWADIYLKATEKFKAFKIPELDYRNPKEIKEKLQILSAFAHVASNTGAVFKTQFKDSNTLSAARKFKEKAGGEEKYREFQNFWASIGAPATALMTGYVKMIPTPPLHDNQAPKFFIINRAAGRYYTGKVMQQIKGLTVEQAAQYTKQTDWSTYLPKFVGNLYRVYTDGIRINTSLISAVKYLNGLPSPEFEKAAEEHLNNRKAVIQKTIEAEINEEYATQTRIDWGSAKQILANIPDDNNIDAMKQFLASNGNYTKFTRYTRDPQTNKVKYIPYVVSGADFVNKNMDKLLSYSQEKNLATEKLGIKPMDVILIDGQTPAEKWKDKYNEKNTPDEREREQLLFLEVLREIALHRSDISFRSFAMKDGEFVEVAPKLFCPKSDDKLRQVFDDVHSYPLGLDSLIRQLESDRDALAATQRDPRANFYNAPGQDEPALEGEEQYKKFTADLKKLHQALTLDKAGAPVEKTDILRYFDNLIASTDAYYREHSYSLRRGFWTESGRNRKNISKRMKDTVRKLKEQYLENRKRIDKEYMANGDSFKNSGYYNVLDRVEVLEREYNIPKQDDAYYKNNHKLNEFKKLYSKFLQTPLTVSAEDKPRYERANQYISAFTREVLKDRRVPEGTILDEKVLEEYFHALAKNPVFQQMMINNPNLCVNRWHEVNAALPQEEQNNIQNLTKLNAMGAAAYVVGLPERDAGAPAYTMDNVVTKFVQGGGDQIHAPKPGDDSFDDDFIDDENEYYNKICGRAADVILTQILNQNTVFSRNLRYAIVASDKTEFGGADLRSKIRTAILDNLQDNYLLTAEKYMTTFTKINDGSLAKDYAAMLPDLVAEVASLTTLSGAPIHNYQDDYKDPHNEVNDELLKALNEDEDLMEGDEINALADKNRPVADKENALVQNGWVILDNPLAGNAKEQNNLLDNPKPAVIPLAISVVQPVLPEFGKPFIQNVNVGVQLPVVNNQVVIPVAPIQPVVLPVVNQEVPGPQLEEQGADQIVNQMNNNEPPYQVIQPLINGFQMYKPEQPQVQPQVQPQIAQPIPQAQPAPQIVQPKPAPQLVQPQPILQPQIGKDGKMNINWQLNDLPTVNVLQERMKKRFYDEDRIDLITELLVNMNSLKKNSAKLAQLEGKSPEEGPIYTVHNVKDYMDQANGCLNIALNELKDGQELDDFTALAVDTNNNLSALIMNMESEISDKEKELNKNENLNRIEEDGDDEELFTNEEQPKNGINQPKPEINQINQPKPGINQINQPNQNKINVAPPKQETDDFNIMNFISEEELAYNLNPTTFSGKGPNNINPAVTMPRNKWEFPYEEVKKDNKWVTQKKAGFSHIPEKILNTGDTDAIQLFMNSKKELTNEERDYLTYQLNSNLKIRAEIEKSNKKQDSLTNPGGRLPVKRTANGGVEITGTSQKKYQTSDNGCWSCSANLLLQARGITGLTQEDIRLFRSFDDYTPTSTSVDTSKAYNQDIANSIIESAGDLMTRLAPDSMVREMEIFKRPSNSSLSEKEYNNKAIEQLSKEIRGAIERDKSPVSLFRFGHYITVTGIENRNGEPYIKYKNSIHRVGTKMDPDVEVWERLEDVIGDSFKSGPEHRAVSITWMADIKMDPKTGKILNAPGSQISVSEDGELEVPDNEVQINTESNFAVPHQVSGKLIAKLGGEERTTFNQLSKDGLNYNEKAYIGKELNYEFLKKKAKMGNFEQEVERARERIQFYKNNIDPKKDVKNKEMFEDKVNCTVILATAAYMKYTLKVPVSDDASAKKALAICTKKENVTAMKNKIEKMSGKDIIEAAEDGTLIGLPKQIKQPEVKGLQVNK